MTKRLKIIYLVGAGNSGSTILGMALGAHSSIVSIGELGHLPKYASTPSELCSCGAPFNTCSFWTPLINIGVNILPSHGYQDVLTRNWRNIKLTEQDRVLIAANERLYQEIARLSGVNVIVDSSKDMRRLCYLTQSNKLEVIPVYIVRDVRAYIDSFLRRQSGTSLEGFLRWIKMNLQTILGLISIGYFDKTLHVGFTDFTQSPQPILEKICAACDIPFEIEMLTYYKHTFHNIDGTKSRFDLKPITPMEDWKKRLPLSGHAIYWLGGGWLFNKLFGANRRLTDHHS